MDSLTVPRALQIRARRSDYVELFSRAAVTGIGNAHFGQGGDRRPGR
jgi:hypothetical protein